ncbi:MAG TPA: 2-succinyl-5-enolpyruvyl-6-hydroxy-3-cyclohexene-1-carboxylic-acid synthase [Acidimicrobiales bacterium]|nr:2-succinyl-5-enolpyruvyl-6-hydroxy-3-cyclohexene-1-carboxylic-acid synthase [Acidimicrobiales bacterium]
MASVPVADGVAAAQSAFALALFDEFARGGLVDVVVCPGSRSTPLVLAAAGTEGLALHVRLDERSAGFFAIGRALVTRRPVAVVVTSGTAAAELTAAVVEADLAGVPIVVVTADRPPELRGVGVPQTIDQVKLYGSAVRRVEDPGAIRPSSAPSWRALASRLLSAAVAGRGPVHLNVPLVEPLDAIASDVPRGRPRGAPWRTVTTPVAATAGAFSTLAGARGLLLAGRGAGDPELVLAVAERHGWPLLADPLSGARFEHPCVVATFDALMGDPDVRGALQPDVVVSLGAPPASRALAEALVEWAPRVLAVDERGWPGDPYGLVSDVLVGSPSGWATAARALAPLGGPEDFLAAWRGADDAASSVFESACATELNEPSLARRLSRALPEDVALVVSNSMPVRDLEWFGARTARPPAVFANRGANGIDGVVSTALGVACGARAVALLGDLAFLHDAGALASGLGEGGGRCVLVVADNLGGGIFSFLPQRRSIDASRFERLFVTPPSVAVGGVAAGYGCEVREVKDLDGLDHAVAAGLATDGVTVVVAAVRDRDRNVELHRVLARAAGDAARATLGR